MVDKSMILVKTYIDVIPEYAGESGREEREGGPGHVRWR